MQNVLKLFWLITTEYEQKILVNAKAMNVVQHLI